MINNPRVAVVTGASSGIGKEVAKALVSMGWRVIGTGRDTVRMVQAEEDIAAIADAGGSIEFLRADLSLIAQAYQLADDIASRTNRVDLLVNNAGRMADRLEMTSEGLEANFAGNHLGPFVLSRQLMPLLHVAAEDMPAGAVRILMTSSTASEALPGIDLDDIQHLKTFNPGFTYCAGKLANVLFTRALAGRLVGTGIVAHAMSPGATDTPFFDNMPREAQEYARDLPKLSVADGADTLIWLATAEEPGRSSGGYWEKRARRQPHSQVEDPVMVERFWLESETLVARASAAAIID